MQRGFPVKTGYECISELGDILTSLYGPEPTSNAVIRLLDNYVMTTMRQKRTACMVIMQLILDNDTAFRNRIFAEFATRCGVRIRYRCAYAPSGNGITERCHRTVKVIAARKGCSIPEAVYLHNITPRDGSTVSSAPAGVVYKYTMRVRGIDLCPEEDQPVEATYAVGDEVWVKPPGGRCDTTYHQGLVTGVISRQAVEVDGTPRHVRDLRRRAPGDESSGNRPQIDNQDDKPIVADPRRIVTRTTLPDADQRNTTGALRRFSRHRRARAHRCCDS
uniref:Integrase catalytic domain-containing protein n=1 Tax=Trichuris muris TaxID=70415 RepID=A0A5S6QCQ1_TRIMR